MNIVERERRAPGLRGPATLPSQGRVHRSPGTSRSSPFSNTYKISHKLQQIGGRRPPSYLLQFVGSQNFIVSRSRFSLQLPGREVLLFRATWREPRSDEHRRIGEAQGPGDPTLPGQGTGPRTSRSSPFEVLRGFDFDSNR